MATHEDNIDTFIHHPHLEISPWVDPIKFGDLEESPEKVPALINIKGRHDFSIFLHSNLRSTVVKEGVS